MTTMKSLFIPIHSFVDLITNSSTEIYVQADKHTIEAIKGVINAILKSVAAGVTADDLFEFDLTVNVDNPKPRAEWGPNESYYVNVSTSSVEGKAYLFDKEDNYESPAKISVSVKSKNPELAQAAQVLSSLTSLFNIEANYNG